MYDDSEHEFENPEAVAVLDGREILAQWDLARGNDEHMRIFLWENGEDVHVHEWTGDSGHWHHPDEAYSVGNGFFMVTDHLIPGYKADGWAVTDYLGNDLRGARREIVVGAGSPETSALTHCPTCGAPEWHEDGRPGWNPVDVECENCAGTYDKPEEGGDV